MKFRRQALQDEGFHGFVTIRKLRQEGLDDVPTNAGVYVVLREIGTPPKFLESNPGGHFRGRDPTISKEELYKRWVKGAHVIYIGKSKNLRRRLRQLKNFGNGMPVAHWGGRVLWQIENSSEFVVAWKRAAKGQDPADLEQQLLQEFHEIHNQKPFANLV